jgi:hypothetical protein
MIILPRLRMFVTIDCAHRLVCAPGKENMRADLAAPVGFAFALSRNSWLT